MTNPYQLGNYFSVMPIPAIAEHCIALDAGPVTLVVESRNFNSKRPGVGDGQMAGLAFRGASQDMRVTEWFTRVDADTILYEFTADDPTAYTKPWKAQIPMKKTQEQLFKFECHEGNYTMEGVLAGARSAEKKASK